MTERGCCPECSEKHDKDVNESINLYLIWLGSHEGIQALVDDHSPYGLPKKPSCNEAGRLTSCG